MADTPDPPAAADATQELPAATPGAVEDPSSATPGTVEDPPVPAPGVEAEQPAPTPGNEAGQPAPMPSAVAEESAPKTPSAEVEPPALSRLPPGEQTSPTLSQPAPAPVGGQSDPGGVSPPKPKPWERPPPERPWERVRPKQKPKEPKPMEQRAAEAVLRAQSKGKKARHVAELKADPVPTMPLYIVDAAAPGGSGHAAATAIKHGLPSVRSASELSPPDRRKPPPNSASVDGTATQLPKKNPLCSQRQSENLSLRAEVSRLKKQAACHPSALRPARAHRNACVVNVCGVFFALH